MSFYPLNDSPLVTKVRKTAGSLPLSKHILYLLLTFLAATFMESVVTFIYAFFAILPHIEEIFGMILSNNTEEYLELALSISSTKEYLLFSLFSTVFTIIACVFFALKIEKRDLASMGIVKKNALPYALLGAVAGVALFSAVLGVSLLNGSVEITSGSFSPLYFFLFLLGFAIQGSSEEILLRGYLMTSLLRVQKPLTAAIYTSAIFALLHLGNPGVNLFAVINIFLFGMAMAVLTLRTGSLVPAMAIHALWNFAEGCIFGSSVSGLPRFPSILYTVIDEGKTLTNGGAFGPEGGIAATLILLLFLVLVVFLPSNVKTEKKEA